MIIRIWRAQATSDGAERYRKLYERSIFPKLQSIDGFREAYLLNRAHSDNDDEVDIEVHTLWESLDAIRAFAGPDVNAAVVGPEIAATLTSYDKTASHFKAQEFGT